MKSNKNKRKSIFIAFTTLVAAALLLALAFFGSAQDDVVPVERDDAITQITTKVLQLGCDVYEILFYLAAAIAALFIVVSGIMYMSSGSEDVRFESRNRITYALVGLIIVLISCPFVNYFIEGTPMEWEERPDCCPILSAGEGSLQETIGYLLCTILSLIYYFASAIAALVIVYAGVKYISSDSMEGKVSAKNIAVQAIVGLILVLIAVPLVTLLVGPYDMLNCQSYVGPLTFPDDGTGSGGDGELPPEICSDLSSCPACRNIDGCKWCSGMAGSGCLNDCGMWSEIDCDGNVVVDTTELEELIEELSSLLERCEECVDIDKMLWCTERSMAEDRDPCFSTKDTCEFSCKDENGDDFPCVFPRGFPGAILTDCDALYSKLIAAKRAELEAAAAAGDDDGDDETPEISCGDCIEGDGEYCPTSGECFNILDWCELSCAERCIKYSSFCPENLPTIPPGPTDCEAQGGVCVFTSDCESVGRECTAAAADECSGDVFDCCCLPADDGTDDEDDTFSSEPTDCQDIHSQISGVCGPTDACDIGFGFACSEDSKEECSTPDEGCCCSYQGPTDCSSTDGSICLYQETCISEGGTCAAEGKTECENFEAVIQEQEGGVCCCTIPEPEIEYVTDCIDRNGLCMTETQCSTNQDSQYSTGCVSETEECQLRGQEAGETHCCCTYDDADIEIITTGEED